MKRIAIVILALGLAAGAYAQGSSIYDIQTGLIAEGTLVTPRGVVTGVTPNGYFVAEAPYDAWRGIWVYEPGHDQVVGDDVQLCGLYKEYYGLSEIDLPAAGIYGSSLKMGTLPVPAPNVVDAADIWTSDPNVFGPDSEAWESCMITVQDGMQVSVLPNTYGEWFAIALDGTSVMFDDYWYLPAQVEELQCYNNATGILNYSFSQFKLEAFAEGIPVVNCTVPTEAVSFSSVKALFR